MNIKEYIKSCKAQNIPPFIESNVIDSNGEDLGLYHSFDDTPYEVYSGYFQKNLTDYMRFHFDCNKIVDSIADELDYADEMIARCMNIYRTNEYKYRTLARSMRLSYNPIENWYRTEESSETFNKGAQNNSATKGSETINFTKGSQTNQDTVGSQTETFNKGAQSNSASVGQQVNTNEYGNTSETMQYGQKETTKEGSNDRTLVYASRTNSDTIGATTQTNTYGDIGETDVIGATEQETKLAKLETKDTHTQVVEKNKVAPMQVEDSFGARHKNNDNARTLGKSAFDDNSSFGDVGVLTDVSGNYKLQPNTQETPNGDDAYNPAEREYNVGVQNESTYTDRHTTTQLGDDGDVKTTDAYDVTRTVEQKDPNNRGDIVSTIQHTDTKTTTHGNDTIGISSRSDSHTLGGGTDTDNLDIDETITEGTHSDTKTALTHTDTLTSGARSDSSTEGAREDSTTIGQRSDSHTEGQRSDSQTNSSRSDSSVEGAREDTRDYTLDAHGNVGVTTAQDMIEQERKLALINLVQIVAQDIIDLCCSRIYEFDED